MGHREYIAMSERYCAWIRIGGRINASKTKSLLKTIREAGASLGWGEPLFAPESTAELIGKLQDDWLCLCDDEARYGEFPELEAACRRLGLGYRRHTEAACMYDAEIVDWRVGMDKPLVRRGSNENTDTVFVPDEAVRAALVDLEAGRVNQAMTTLKALCPDIPDLPPFSVV